jgi:DNA-binding transcriptional MerR regulator
MSSTFTIAEVAERTGLSKDTLRWYENEGLIPSIERDGSGYRVYSDTAVRLIELILRLRRTGMPVREMKDFVNMALEGKATQARRMELLEGHRMRVLAQLAQLEGDLDAITEKITHYSHVITTGGDCGDGMTADSDLFSRSRV